MRADLQGWEALPADAERTRWLGWQNLVDEAHLRTSGDLGGDGGASGEQSCRGPSWVLKAALRGGVAAGNRSPRRCGPFVYLVPRRRPFRGPKLGSRASSNEVLEDDQVDLGELQVGFLGRE